MIMLNMQCSQQWPFTKESLYLPTTARRHSSIMGTSLHIPNTSLEETISKLVVIETCLASAKRFGAAMPSTRNGSEHLKRRCSWSIDPWISMNVNLMHHLHETTSKPTATRLRKKRKISYLRLSAPVMAQVSCMVLVAGNQILKSACFKSMNFLSPYHYHHRWQHVQNVILLFSLNFLYKDMLLCRSHKQSVVQQKIQKLRSARKKSRAAEAGVAVTWTKPSCGFIQNKTSNRLNPQFL